MTATRLLIVDDTPLNITLARAVLEADGFLVESATDAADAMHKVFRFLPEVILMDIQMPGMDGVKLTSILKATSATTKIVVIAFTAYAMRGDEEKMRALGLDGYLSKPIEVKTFAAQVRREIALAAQRPAASG
jgi:two-component system cell cycle response regulator DivK